MIRFWDMTNVHNKRMPCHFLVFGTLFHKVIVAQLSGGRNTVFAKVPVTNLASYSGTCPCLHSAGLA